MCSKGKSYRAAPRAVEPEPPAHAGTHSVGPNNVARRNVFTVHPDATQAYRSHRRFPPQVDTSLLGLFDHLRVQRRAPQTQSRSGGEFGAYFVSLADKSEAPK